MKVFLQRPDGLFFKSDGVWVKSKRDALSFGNCTPAIDFCVENGLSEARLCLSFGHARHDLQLEIFRGETKRLVEFSRELRARRDALLKQLDLARAERKDRIRGISFPRKRDCRNRKRNLNPGSTRTDTDF